MFKVILELEFFSQKLPSNTFTKIEIIIKTNFLNLELINTDMQLRYVQIGYQCYNIDNNVIY